jgi:ribosomal protein S18 acetylase RimI-like enzyme
MALMIRNARLLDVPVLVDFNVRMALETEHKELNVPTLTQGVEAVLKDTSKGLYFVAEEAGAIVGQMMITYEWSDWRNGTFWWIQSVYVKEEWRGKGIYSALYSHVTERAANNKGICGLRLYVEHDNERAKRTYEKNGMVKTPYELFEFELRP